MIYGSDMRFPLVFRDDSSFKCWRFRWYLDLLNHQKNERVRRYGQSQK